MDPSRPKHIPKCIVVWLFLPKRERRPIWIKCEKKTNQQLLRLSGNFTTHGFALKVTEQLCELQLIRLLGNIGSALFWRSWTVLVPAFSGDRAGRVLRSGDQLPSALRSFNLYCCQPQGGSPDASAWLLGSSCVIHHLLWSTILTSKQKKGKTWYFYTFYLWMLCHECHMSSRVHHREHPRDIMGH